MRVRRIMYTLACLAALAISVGAGWKPGSNALSIVFDLLG